MTLRDRLEAWWRTPEPIMLFIGIWIIMIISAALWQPLNEELANPMHQDPVGPGPILSLMPLLVVVGFVLLLVYGTLGYIEVEEDSPA